MLLLDHFNEAYVDSLLRCGRMLNFVNKVRLRYATNHSNLNNSTQWIV